MHFPALNRRQTLKYFANGFGMLGLAGLLHDQARAAPSAIDAAVNPLAVRPPLYAARARRIIFLFMSGGPSHVDLLDHKPLLRERHGTERPPSIRGTQRVTLMTRNQGHFQAAATPYAFRRAGRCGHEMSELGRVGGAEHIHKPVHARMRGPRAAVMDETDRAGFAHACHALGAKDFGRRAGLADLREDLVDRDGRGSRSAAGPALEIEERAACGLAQSGMLNREQRRTALPRLLDYAEDPSLDSDTHKWVFQALRDITGQTLPHDAAAWRQWYDSRR